MPHRTGPRPQETRGELEKLFVRLIHRSFDDLQVGDPKIREYVKDLLCRFARTDALYQIRDPRGRKIETVVELLMERECVAASEGGAEREVQRHTGDYALFMSGIFRAYVDRNGFLGLYLQAGPRAYRAAAELERNLAGDSVGQFETLAREFEHLSGAIDYMRKVYFGNAMMQGDLSEVARRFSLWN